MSIWYRQWAAPRQLFIHSILITAMQLQLINGHFSPQEAVDILTKMTNVKVSYHEQQISASDAEEDVKYREKRIKDLQRNLQEARQAIAQSSQPRVSLKADIIVTINPTPS